MGARYPRPSFDPKLPSFSKAKLHRILGHAGPEVIDHIFNQCYGINVDDSKPAPTTNKCTTCSLAKATKVISRRSGSEIPRSGKPFDTLCWDAMVMEEGYNGDKYVSHFYCPDSHFNFSFTCASKKEFKLTLRAVLNIIRNQWGLKVRIFRLDGETSLINERERMVVEEGILCNVSAAHTPEQNGLSERSGGVIVVKGRAMGLEANLPTNLWPETMIAAGYIANRTPVKQLEWKTPFEIVHKVKPGYAHLQVFGCRAYVLNKHLAKSRKLDARAHIGHLVGYDSTNIYRIWIPSKNKVVRTRDVTFDDEKFYDPLELDLGAVSLKRPYMGCQNQHFYGKIIFKQL